MRVKPRGTHRWEYHTRWFSWALPLLVAIGTSYYPVEGSLVDDLGTWAMQRVLIVDVLCLRMQVVLWGPLFDDGEEGEG
jgi:hypothetical protein